MLVRARFIALTAVFLGSLLPMVSAPPPVQAGAPKVAIIVGPVASMTSGYRTSANRVADAATAVGATVAKAYSPNATWANVKAAINGANVVVYFGHGNGFPNPYSSTENLDRVNGWGLNRTTTNGDADDWSKTMAYCGERAILGTLTSGDDAIRQQYCGGTANDGITPAPGFTMVYAQAHYAPGFGERYNESDPLPTLTEAQQRVRNYSYPMLKLGAGAYIATAYGDAHDIVARLLTSSTSSYGDIFRAGEGYTASALKVMPHPDIADAEVWVQKTALGANMHFGDPDYWYAFAGDPYGTPSGTTVLYRDTFSDIWDSPFRDSIVWLAESGITGGCAPGRFCPQSTVTRAQMASFLVRALRLPAATQDYFTDDEGSVHEPHINALTAAGITGGCGAGTYCPSAPVSRAQMASFMTRGLGLAASPEDFYDDDAGSQHEPNINAFAAAAITGGCGDRAFCPSASVTRGQMAAFLYRALT